MADFHSASSVTADEETLFEYLSDVSNLPHYFTRMTSAELGQGEEVHTTAQMPDGQQVEGDAWFRVDAAEHKIEWGSEGPSAYHGSLEVTADGDGSRVDVRLHTTRVADGDSEVTHGFEETLANIKRLVEGQRPG